MSAMAFPSVLATACLASETFCKPISRTSRACSNCSRIPSRLRDLCAAMTSDADEACTASVSEAKENEIKLSVLDSSEGHVQMTTG